MNKLLLALAATALVGGCLVEERRVYAPPVNPVSPGEVSAMAQSGFTQDQMISLIQANGVTRKPTADDIIEMKKAGATDAVVTAMVQAPVRVPTPAVQYVYSDTYYYPSYGYYYVGWPDYYYCGPRYYYYGGYRWGGCRYGRWHR